MIDKNELDHLTGAAESDDSKRLVLTFNANVGALQEIQPGDEIVSGVTSRTPYGMLQKVVSVNRQGGSVTLETVEASMEEAIWRGRIEEYIEQTAAQVVSTRILAEGVRFRPDLLADPEDFREAVSMALSFNYDFDNVKLGYDADYLLLNGHAGLSFKAEFKVEIDMTWPSLDDQLDGDVLPDVDLKSVDFGVTVSEEMDINGSASVNAPLGFEESPVEHELRPSTSR
ncbi:MAG: hypothetical protein ACUVT4_05210 [Actinomycetota bacterium]